MREMLKRCFFLHPNEMTDTLLGALAKRKDVNNLTAVSNNAGSDDSGLGNVSFIPFIFEHKRAECFTQGNC
jgi:hypothetical protein